MHDEDHDHDQGLAHDLRKLAERRDGRRRVLRLLAGASVFALLGSCGSDGSGNGATDTGDGDGGDGDGDGDSSGSCETIPSETAGPYPGNGTNGANALALAGIVRSDIRQSVGDASAVAEGVALTVTL